MPKFFAALALVLLSVTAMGSVIESIESQPCALEGDRLYVPGEAEGTFEVFVCQKGFWKHLMTQNPELDQD